MARPLTSSRLRRYVGGLAALSVVRPEAIERLGPDERPTGARPALRLVPRREEPTDLPEAPATAQTLAQAEALVGREDWARAQRLLEEAIRRDHDPELISYLEDVRGVRRAQRRLLRRPRDASLHVELGRLYFGLELGDQAAAELRRAIEIEPTLVDAHFYLALEHLFRDEEEASRKCLARAAALRPEVPSYETLYSLLWQPVED
jgi:tetratricopeptide (TPR) repeat protein